MRQTLTRNMLLSFVLSLVPIKLLLLRCSRLKKLSKEEVRRPCLFFFACCPFLKFVLASILLLFTSLKQDSDLMTFLLSQVMKCMVIIFVRDVRLYVCRKKYNMISARDITGVASHGKHTRATEHVNKLGNKIEHNFPLGNFGPQNCPASGYGNFVGPKVS